MEPPFSKFKGDDILNPSMDGHMNLKYIYIFPILTESQREGGFRGLLLLDRKSYYYTM